MHMTSSAFHLTRATRGDALAAISAALALFYPAALLINDIAIIVRYIGSSLTFRDVATTHMMLDFFGAPVLLAAIVLGHFALASARRRRGLARASLVIGYVSLAGLVMTVITLGVLTTLLVGRQ